MSRKPKPAFWITVFVVAAGLVAFSLYRAGVFLNPPPPVVSTSEIDSPNPAPSAQPAVLTLNFYSSSAKRNWIDEMVKTFNAAGIRSGGAVIRVKAVHVTSGGSLDDLKNGAIQPDLWSPGDESWLHLAAVHWRMVKQRPLFDNFSDLVNIPLVVAMWEPMARVLGYPGPIGWRDIAAVAADPDGWAAKGHPEWGKFRWGHAHPDANSGFLTIISEVYAALGKTENIAPDDLKRPETMTFLETFEGAVEHYGLSNSWIDDLMHAKGPAYLSATVQYENTIIQSNEKYGNKPFKLVAIYPTEGNFWTRHPVAILKESWMTPEKEAACRKFVAFLLSPEAQQRAMEIGLRPILKDIAMGSPFDEIHGTLPDVDTTRMFQVPDENVLKRIRDLWEAVKVPATVCMVLDRSGSMKGEPLENANRTNARVFTSSPEEIRKTYKELSANF